MAKNKNNEKEVDIPFEETLDKIKDFMIGKAFSTLYEFSKEKELYLNKLKKTGKYDGDASNLLTSVMIMLYKLTMAIRTVLEGSNGEISLNDDAFLLEVVSELSKDEQEEFMEYLFLVLDSILEVEIKTETEIDFPGRDEKKQKKKVQKTMQHRQEHFEARRKKASEVYSFLFPVVNPLEEHGINYMSFLRDVFRTSVEMPDQDNGIGPDNLMSEVLIHLKNKALQFRRLLREVAIDPQEPYFVQRFIDLLGDDAQFLVHHTVTHLGVTYGLQKVTNPAKTAISKKVCFYIIGLAEKKIGYYGE